MTTSNITIEEVTRIAELAHLELSAEETSRMTTELGKILQFVRQLQELDLSSVPPTQHGQLEQLPLRPDVSHVSLPTEVALREATTVEHGGFRVPAFVDEG